MMSRRIRVFFYGLFMDVDVLRAKDIHPANPRRGSVPGFSLALANGRLSFPTLTDVATAC